MSRTEHDTFRESACLCGKGQVTKHVVSTDYVFSSTEVSYELECPTCAVEWRFEHRVFTLRSSEREYSAAKALLETAQRELSALAREIIDAHFEKENFGTKKAELQELERLNLSGGNYRNYTSERRLNRTPGQIANVYREGAAIATIARREQQPVFERLATRVTELKTRCDAAAKKIVRKRLPVE